MSVKCQICDKRPGYGNNKTRRRWLPNLQNVRIRMADGVRKRMRVCTQCIRSGRTLVNL